MKYRTKLLAFLLLILGSSGCGGGTAEMVSTPLTPTMRPPKPTITKTTAAPKPTNTLPADPSNLPLPNNLPSCIDPVKREIGIITEIIDGDTIIANIDGVSRRVRYIGIDTPEMDSPGNTAQLAKNANSQLTFGKQAQLFSDVTNTDPYDRYLRFVFVDDVFINQELVAQGLAEEQEYPPNITCAETLRQAENFAKKSGLGIWFIAKPDPSAALPKITALNKKEEYVIITNQGSVEMDLVGWVLMSERGNQACTLAGKLPAGASLKIYAQTGVGGFNCGNTEPIWNNSKSDPAVLFDPSGAVIDRWED